MKKTVLVALAMAIAGAALAQNTPRPDPKDPSVSVPPTAYRSAFEGYRPFADQEVLDWRKANEDVGAASGHAGHRPDKGSRRPSAKPAPRKSQGSPAHKGPDAPAEKGHGGHK